MDLADLLAPRDGEHARLAHEIYASRPDLQRAFPEEAGLGYRQWLGTCGILEYPPLTSFYPPVPPDSLRRTASFAGDALAHLRSGAEDLRALVELHEAFGTQRFAELGSVLDFGCGCGRLLRWLEAALPAARLFGADVRAASIDWCRANLRGTFLANAPQPRLPLADASIDLVVALSVFSHLNLRSNLAWIRELARVCKPGGSLLVTTHGALALALIARSPEHQRELDLPVDRARDYLRRLEREHFLFHPVPSEILSTLDGVEEDYGQVFFDAEFVRQHWAGEVELLGCVPAAHQLFQDVFALRPRVRRGR